MTRPGGFERYGPTIRVEGGLKAQSTRGAIGESWWSKRFLAVLESFEMASRLTRGRSYARAGQVLSLDILPGSVASRVQGSRPVPYTVDIKLHAYDHPTWTRIEQAMASQALFLARLLAGEMPTQIEEAFVAADAPLFPTRSSDLAMSCSCPDWGMPCKHIAATFYLLAEAFDADPFQILHWRGRDRETLLTNLRALRATEGGAATKGKAKPPPGEAQARARPTSSHRCHGGTARHEQPGSGRNRGPVLGRTRPIAAPATRPRHRRRPGAASAARARPGARRRRAHRTAALALRRLPPLTVLTLGKRPTRRRP